MIRHSLSDKQIAGAFCLYSINRHLLPQIENIMKETMHEAEAYLRNPKNPTSLYVKIYGRRRRLFINRDSGNQIGIVAVGKRKWGNIFFDWKSIEKVYYPEQEKEKKETNLVLKYQKLAKLATFHNSWLDVIAKADPTKGLYENHITTGTSIDGKCIRLPTIEKYCGAYTVEYFLRSLKEKRVHHSERFDFCGYDGSLWVNVDKEGNVSAGFCKEYRGCGNGYYYLMINDNTFIGYDID